MPDPIPQQTETVVNAAGAAGTTNPNRVSSASSEEGRFVPGTIVAGRYRVISLLGRGGMGEVYRATDLTLAQPVALKFLPETSAQFQRTLERFHNEVRVARQVSHPNVCRVYDLGEVDGMPYISMEYVDGEDLESLLHRIGRLPADKALDVARKICAGIAAAHDKGVIHRDLKPANVMLDKRGQVVVMDFGLAAVADELHGAEARSGTPAYMAPEQLRGEEVTARSDIYSLGLVLYELFTGKRAFEAKTQAELMRLQEATELTSMSSVAAEIDPAVEKVVRRCLDPNPAKRPAGALSVSAALPGGDPLAAALAAGETPSPELVAASGKTDGLPLTRSAPLALALAALIIGVPLLERNVELHSLAPLDLAPEALVAKIREHATSFGYANKPADFTYDLHWIDAIITEARKNKGQDLRARFDAESPLQLAYRESPLPLLAPPDGQVTEDRPAPAISGMIEAWVTSKGELRRFRAVPPQISPASGSTASVAPVDTQSIARAIGFDLSKWAAAPPPFAPLYAFDWIQAWKGKHPGLGLDLTVQASAWHGRVTEVTVIWPWSQPGRMPVANQRSASDSAFRLLAQLTAVLLFLFASFLAVRNLRAGRGDRRGASRLAAVCCLLLALRWISSAHWIARLEMIDIAYSNATSWLALAALMWLLYVALEPAVRARWPHAMVTWSRVLAGRWRDPLVAAHILYGALTGVAIQYLFLAEAQFSVRRGLPGNWVNAGVGGSARHWLAMLAAISSDAILAGLLIVFAIFCLRVVCRKDWLASIAAAALFAVREGQVWRSGEPVTFLAFVAIFALLAFVLLRLGLVSTIAAFFFINMISKTPGAQDLTKWYEWTVIAYPALTLAIVVWAFWRTSGQQALAVD